MTEGEACVVKTDSKEEKEPIHPDGWKLSELGDLLEVKYGKGLPKNIRKPNGVPVYGSNGIIGQHEVPLTKGPTIIIGRKGTVGAVHFSDLPCWPIDTTYFIDEFQDIDPAFIVFALRSVNLPYLDTSTAIPGLNREDLYNQKIPLPPIEEQKRIVSKLDELLPRVNAVRERLIRVKEIMKRFRQSVLSAACSGRLTEEWRNGKALGKAQRVNMADEHLGEDTTEVPASWSIGTIEQLASRAPRSIQSGPFGSNLHHSEFQKEGTLVIGIDNVLEGRFSLGKQHRVSQKKYGELRKYTARPLDVLLTVMGTVGRCCVVPGNLETAIITKHVYRITADHTKILPHYLMSALRGDPFVVEQINEQIRGQTRPGINGNILKNLKVRVPSIEEQSEIVQRVEALFKQADKIEKSIEVELSRTEKITQAVLAKAFRGELVSTEADLGRRGGEIEK